MKLKHAILEVMSRDDLKRALDDLGLNGVDRRSVADMTDRLSRAHRATPEVLLGYLDERQVKQVCELTGQPANGRRAALVEALLETEGGYATVVEESSGKAPKAREMSAPYELETKPSKRKGEKKVTRYTYDEVKEPRTPETGHTSLLPAEDLVVTLPMDNGWSKEIEVGKLPDGEERPVVVDMDPAADPVLFWAGKRNRREVPVLPLQRNEIVSESRIAQIIERARRAADEKSGVAQQGHLFADLEKTLREADRGKRVEFYTHEEGWKNKLICGDSLHVMESLLHYENLRGKVQMIYIDPPYGIKYDSNFQQRVDSTKNEEKDAADDVLTIKAFRDTWSLGIHSYLSYLQERLYLCRELLSGTGSIFVQIGEENIHLVRALMDEVFGKHNCCGLIVFAKTSSQASLLLSSVSDYLLWYATDRTQASYRQLYKDKVVGGEKAGKYAYVEFPNGKWRALTPDEDDDPSAVPAGGRVFAIADITSAGSSETSSFPFEFEAKLYVPPRDTHWKTSKAGMERLASLGRIIATGTRLRKH